MKDLTTKPSRHIRLLILGATLVSVLLAGWLLLILTGSRHPAAPASLVSRPAHLASLAYEKGDYERAAELATTPVVRASALYRAGEFKDAADALAGEQSPDAYYLRGTALIFLGRYTEAVTAYDHALALRPDWEDARINREVAHARAEKLKQEGGDMTGGKLGADEIVFTNKKPPPGAGDEIVDEAAPLSDEAIRATWMRRVQTRPGDFLRAKFLYQESTGKEGSP